MEAEAINEYGKLCAQDTLEFVLDFIYRNSLRKRNGDIDDSRIETSLAGRS